MFERQWFDQSTQAGLHNEFVHFEHLLATKRYCAAWEVLFSSKHITPRSYQLRQSKRLYYISQRPAYNSIYIAFDGFWPNFNYKSSLIYQIFLLAADQLNLHLTHTNNPHLADILISSCFPNQFSSHSCAHCTHVLFLGENVRPSYSNYDYSFTFDLFDYLGRNVHLPLWLCTLYEDMACILSKPPSISPIDLSPYTNYCSEFWLPWHERKNAVAYVGNNFEPLRTSAIHYLRMNGVTVDMYGSHTVPVSNKIELYGTYKYVLCPENSFSHGYITEKLIHSSLSGAISLYWGGIDLAWKQAIGNRLIYIDSEKYLEPFFKQTGSDPLCEISAYLTYLSHASSACVVASVDMAKKVLRPYTPS